MSLNRRRADTAGAWRRVVHDYGRRRSGMPLRVAPNSRSRRARVAPLAALHLAALALLEPCAGARARPPHASPPTDRLWIALSVGEDKPCANSSPVRTTSADAQGVPSVMYLSGGVQSMDPCGSRPAGLPAAREICVPPTPPQVSKGDYHRDMTGGRPMSMRRRWAPPSVPTGVLSGACRRPGEPRGVRRGCASRGEA